MKLAGKTALITGAAGQLGRVLCAALAREGASVWVSDLETGPCDALAAGLPGPGSHRGLALDVADPESVETAFAEVGSSSGRLDVLVNNAGIAVFTPFEERPFEDFMRVMRVNAGGTFLCIRAGSRLMRESGAKGSIVNIGSIYGMVSSDPRIYTDCARNNSECYSASKAAVIQLTRYFAVHLAPHAIRVNCVSPGGVYNRQGPDFVKRYGDRAPLGRMAEAGEIPPAVVFLASDEASYVTGQNLAVEGGWTVW